MREIFQTIIGSLVMFAVALAIVGLCAAAAFLWPLSPSVLNY